VSALLDIRGLRAGYGAVEVLRGIDLQVNEGEAVALLGSNGAGKSTLNNVVCGLFPAWAGQVGFDGADLTGAHYRTVVQAGLIQVPEGRRIFPNLTVLENLELGAFTRARERRERNLERAYSLFPRLRERMRQAAGTLSGGEQQMLAIGRGLMAEPRLLILDRAVATAGRGALHADPPVARRRPFGAAGRAERRPVARGGGSRLRAGERGHPLFRRAVPVAGQRRAAPRLPGALTANPA
jgi:ABC-type branched-subunit amino acid transport system ATPase component